MAAVAAALLASAFLTAVGSAAVPNRDEYVARLESICKPHVEATQRVMKGVKDEIRNDKLNVAAAKFARGTKIFTDTVSVMTPVPRPEGDVEKLRKWFGLLGQEEGWLRRITAALRAGQTIQTQRNIAHLIHTGNLANNVVIAFGFNYCRFRFPRFSG